MATTVALAIGIVIGAVAGYFGGWVDTLLSRIIDTLMAFPILALGPAVGIWAMLTLKRSPAAQKLANGPHFAARMTKKMVQQELEMGFTDAIEAIDCAIPARTHAGAQLVAPALSRQPQVGRLAQRAI